MSRALSIDIPNIETLHKNVPKQMRIKRSERKKKKKKKKQNKQAFEVVRVTKESWESISVELFRDTHAACQDQILAACVSVQVEQVGHLDALVLRVFVFIFVFVLKVDQSSWTTRTKKDTD